MSYTLINMVKKKNYKFLSEFNTEAAWRASAAERT